ncbi:MAG: hypothetical protein EPO39_01520 [Candidatus Manganitrophaceae bacterium]|nr:MAG: hypothetical protein EPO39_01520 [Candidatus Manganitrophaceae bacterium]
MKTKMIPMQWVALSLGMLLFAAPLFAIDSDGMKMQKDDMMMKEGTMSADEMNRKGDQMISEGTAMKKKAAMMKKEMKKGNQMKGDGMDKMEKTDPMGEMKSDSMKK